ncbi:MAG: 5-(carboxyamino)imidazole ribonucleotide mutase [Clostridiales bacterium]|jgi:phosphoribosylaminoimidazole carboxylase PurE protein|nr:5-(carboxyamino)imidazole ribonucleotide mutase [Clostridiales bacterium]
MVSIIMGSDSDLYVMEAAAEVLRKLDIPYEMKIISAHRTPEIMFNYAKRAKENNIDVIIAGAGGAAHLPGMVASLTAVPVIGVPVKATALGGLDSLYSIVQMPAGVPVATVAIDGARNAGLLAAQILAVNDTGLYDKLMSFKDSLKDLVLYKNSKLEKGSQE